MIAIRTDEPERAARLLRERDIPANREEYGVSVSVGAGINPAEINTLLVRAGIAVSALETRHQTLEDTFLDLTNQPEMVA